MNPVPIPEPNPSLGPGRRIALDVCYRETSAIAAGAVFDSWDSKDSSEDIVVHLDSIADYEPGQFYRRELPCLLEVLGKVRGFLECIVIDGYVSLGPEQKPGLGMHLWEALSQRVPIIGVAKSRYLGTPDEAKIHRGDSLRPLFVTAIGISLDEAKAAISGMHGPHRIPTILKHVDRLGRDLKVPEQEK